MDYTDAMNLYGAIISLQEAERWLEAGFIDRAKTDIGIALKQLEEIAEKEKRKNDRKRDNPSAGR